MHRLFRLLLSHCIQARDSLIDPEYGGGGDASCGHESVGASVIAGVKTRSVLELPKHVPDFAPSPGETGPCMIGSLRLTLNGIQAVISLFAMAARNQPGSYPLSASKALAFGKAPVMRAAPLQSLMGPSPSRMTNARPWPSQTACSFEFGPIFVRPIRRGTAPLFCRLAAVR